MKILSTAALLLSVASAVSAQCTNTLLCFTNPSNPPTTPVQWSFGGDYIVITWTLSPGATATTADLTLLNEQNSPVVDIGNVDLTQKIYTYTFPTTLPIDQFYTFRFQANGQTSDSGKVCMIDNDAESSCGGTYGGLSSESGTTTSGSGTSTTSTSPAASGSPATPKPGSTNSANSVKVPMFLGIVAVLVAAVL